LAGEPPGRSTWSHRRNLGRRKGGSGTGRRGATAAGVGGHGSSGSGELSAGAREWAARPALLGPRGGARGVGRQWMRGERRLNRGGAQGAVASTTACARRAGSHLNSRSGFLPSRRSKGPGFNTDVWRPTSVGALGGEDTGDGPQDVARCASGKCGFSTGVCADFKGASVRVAPREGAWRGSDGEAGVAEAQRTRACPARRRGAASSNCNWHCLEANFSKDLNRSAQSDE
jgi:hypothetical protein